MKCLVYLPHSYTGRGPAESCIRIIEHFSAKGIQPTVFVHRAKAPIPASAQTVEAGGGLLHKVPFRIVAPLTGWRLQQQFTRAVNEAEPGTIAYFWPDTPIELVRHAKAKGLICVREMINNPLARAKPILDAAYREAGLEPSHGITDARVLAENEELALYNLIYSSNAEVDAALRALGIAGDRILPASFGWTKGRFKQSGVGRTRSPGAPLRAVFVGLMNVRKGIPTLLKAWEMANVEGELIMAGAPEECLKPLIDRYCQRSDIRHLGHVSDVESLYRSSDVFVFPTHEEGGPQVTYEAAACGLPVITTPMGGARLIADDETGMIVPAGDAEALAAALHRMWRNPEIAVRLAGAARDQVDHFEYAHVGEHRADLLVQAAAAVS